MPITRSRLAEVEAQSKFRRLWSWTLKLGQVHYNHVREIWEVKAKSVVISFQRYLFERQVSPVCYKYQHGDNFTDAAVTLTYVVWVWYSQSSSSNKSILIKIFEEVLQKRYSVFQPSRITYLILKLQYRSIDSIQLDQF